MSALFRATESFIADVRQDLMRPHPFAHERIGFIAVRAAQGHNHLVLIAEDYYPVADNEYVQDRLVGARIGQEALRKALNVALLNPVGMFHVHMHLFPERLWFSRVDLSEQFNFVPDFFKVRPTMPHGALVLSPHSFAGRAWVNSRDIQRIDEFNTVGARVRVTKAARDGSTDFYG